VWSRSRAVFFFLLYVVAITPTHAARYAFHNIRRKPTAICDAIFSRSLWPVDIYWRMISVCRQLYEPEKNITNVFINSKAGGLVVGGNRLYTCVDAKEHIDQHIPYTRGINWWNCIWNEHESWTEVVQEWLMTTEILLCCMNQDMWTAVTDSITGATGIRADNVTIHQFHIQVQFNIHKCQRRTDILLCVIKQDSVQRCFHVRHLSLFSFWVIQDVAVSADVTVNGISAGYVSRHVVSDLLFCWPCIMVYQYSETNVMHFLFNLLRIKGLYMFRALLAQPQEVLHKRRLVDCVRVMSVGCTRIEVPLHSWCSQLT
jgi:hypothetical protein